MEEMIGHADSSPTLLQQEAAGVKQLAAILPALLQLSGMSVQN
jgi:hypothetical protein